jgi:hypothetical protein
MVKALRPAAIGFRAHSGWAALVAVAGSRRRVEVVDRRRLVTCDPKIAGSKQPYHAAEGLPFARAEMLVGRCLASSRQLARTEIKKALRNLEIRGLRVVGCGLLLASGRPLPSLADILGSHALIHAAEGEMYRDVLARAAGHYRLPVAGIRERELFARAEKVLGLPSVRLRRILGELGKPLGPPWTQDQKLAALAAWLALAS